MRDIQLNNEQQEAVNQIDGPLLVLAGPGTGKTQLLSERVANILKQTDTKPNNILCLTYTEAGVTAMKERLAATIGSDGYQVSIHTFHSFALEVMRRFPDYFLDSRNFSAIDELTSYQLLEKILNSLPPNFKLAHRSFARENRISDLTSKISELKKTALTPQDAKELYQTNQKELQSLSEILQIIPKDIPRAKADGLKLIEELASYLQAQAKIEINSKPSTNNQPIPSIRKVILQELTQAISESLETSKTKSITSFKNAHLEKDSSGNWRFKDAKYNQNLQEVSHIYKLYSEELQKAEKLDFDDMILNLISAVKKNDDLKYNIQEQWQYILVDEFQDTSFAQLEIIRLIGDHPSPQQSPNIMVVGDDDQAIYAFQGASVSNIQSFVNLYKDTKVITLQDNYRSNQNIIDAGYQTAKFIEERPAGTSIKKLLKKSSAADAEVSIVTLTNNHSELSWLCKDIKEQIQSGQKPEEIAILAPRHRQLQELALELNSNHIPVYYESASNILDDEIIQELLSLSSLVIKIASGEVTGSNSLLSEVLDAPYWSLPTGSTWQLALYASKSKESKHWFEHLSDDVLGEAGRNIHRQILQWANLSRSLSLEQMLDLLIGVNGEASDLSPFKEYYFSKQKLHDDPTHYAEFLAGLATLRDHLRSYFPDLSKPKLVDLLNYTQLCEQHGGIRISRRGLHIKPNGVNLITAYGSKGLEFNQVYIIHSTEDVWSESARGKNDTLKFTSNFSSHKDSSDDKTRLFYVAQTRAKNRLTHTLHKFDEKGREKVLLRYLQPLKVLPTVNTYDLSDQQMSVEDSAAAYEQKLFGNNSYNLNNSTLKDILAPLLENYRLSATHLSTWLDEKHGGPEAFITRHLLRFPQAMSESAVHGSAVHKAMEKAHLAHKNNIIFDKKDFIDVYIKELDKSALDESTKNRMGQMADHLFNSLMEDIKKLVNSTALPEVDIKNNFQGIRLSGKIDAIVIDEQKGTAIVRDYKTGKPGAYIDPKYKNQLYFYKLLLEQSPDRLPKNISLAGAELVYLNPTEDSVVTLKLNYKDSEYKEFKTLLKNVWNEIMNLGVSSL